jgi:hypothetical protein
MRIYCTRWLGKSYRHPTQLKLRVRSEWSYGQRDQGWMRQPGFWAKSAGLFREARPSSSQSGTFGASPLFLNIFWACKQLNLKGGRFWFLKPSKLMTVK